MQSLIPSSVGASATVVPRKIDSASAAEAAAAIAAPLALLSGRPNGGRRPSKAADRREWDDSDHFGLDTEAVPRARRGLAASLPLVRLENPGHSWLFAGLDHVLALGIADRITGASYIVGSSAALEEDCDAPVFAEAAGAALGRAFDWSGDVRTVYDGLFEWDHAYDNLERRAKESAGARTTGGARSGILCPFSAPAARRIAHGGATPP